MRVKREWLGVAANLPTPEQAGRLRYFGCPPPEDNLHAPNEGFSLDVMKKGTATTRRILEAVAKGEKE